MMGVQIVHHQYDPVFVRVVLVHQLPDHPCPIDFGTPVRHFNPAPPLQRREHMKRLLTPLRWYS